MPRYADKGNNLLYRGNVMNGLKSRKYSKIKEKTNDDKSIIRLPRQYTGNTPKVLILHNVINLRNLLHFKL